MSTQQPEGLHPHRLQKPFALTPNLDGIPAELRAIPHWVVWKWEEREGKQTKVPYSPRTGKHARVNAPKTWSTFAEAVEAYRKGGYAGLGFVFRRVDPAGNDGRQDAGGVPPLVGIDLDKCRNPETGEITPEAQKIVKRINSYTEVSPSDTGLHIWVVGCLPPGGRRKDHFEMYDQGRFFCVTGHHFPNTPTTIEERTEQLTALHKKVFSSRNARFKSNGTRPGGNSAAALTLDDSQILEKVMKAKNGDTFRHLWEGDTSLHGGDDSRADLAFCNYLAFYTKDPTQIDRIFHQSGLWREKWDKKHYGDGRTYGEGTIAAAIAGTPATYSPGNGHTPGNGAEPPPEPVWDGDNAGVPPPADTPDTDPHRFGFTDLGNAERLVRLHGSELRHCEMWGSWLIWDGRRWVKDDNGEVERRAMSTVRAIYKEASQEDNQDKRTAVAKHALASEKKTRITHMIDLAKSKLPIAVRPADFDRDPRLLNVANGTVNLQTGELQPHRKEDLITRLAPVNYDPDALCPLFLEFLRRIMGEDDILISFLQRAVGYSLTGDTSEQCLFLLHGAGANGKSTFIEVIRALLGDYAQQADFSTFLHKDHDPVRNDLAKLRDARFVSAVEVTEGKRLAEVVVKQLTGGDTITARFLFHEYFEFRLAGKIWLAANHLPVIRGTDNAIWRRIRLIPFTITIPREEQDKRLLQKLKAELPGILNWALHGCLEWQREGLCEPGEVQAATEAYREEMDPVGAFLAECCVMAPEVQAPASDLYEAYTKWCQANGEESINQTVFGRRLRDRGLIKDRAAITWRTVWKGVGLRSSL
jgi:putative DNA primase/helicase